MYLRNNRIFEYGILRGSEFGLYNCPILRLGCSVLGHTVTLFPAWLAGLRGEHPASYLFARHHD